jgi:3-oxoadipate enol-lactonase / 4-carboxymuconolactone decarboxylase
MTVKLHWQDEGPVGAPVLVLLNSLGTSTAMWDAQAGALAEQFRVVRIDARGHGRSPAAPPDEPSTIADLGTDVLAVLDQLDAKRVHLAGVSLGGMTAMWLAIHHPNRVARLAVLCSSAFPGNPAAWQERAATVSAEGMAAIADAVVARWITPSLAASDPQLVQLLRSQLLGTDPESYAQCCHALAELDLRTDLGRIAAPTLVIAGADDQALPPEHSQVIAAGVTGARLEVLGSAAHIAPVEQSGTVTDLLLEHFSGGATLARGLQTRRAVLGDQHVDRALANTSELTKPFQEFITRYAWGDVWSRPGLGRRERSITTLASLVTLGADHEIAMHVRAALRNGLTREEISEVLLHTALYAGLPRANRAFAIAQETLADVSTPTKES